MRKYENGQYVDMTEEEITALAQGEVLVEPTTEERLSALEAAMLEQILGV